MITTPPGARGPAEPASPRARGGPWRILFVFEPFSGNSPLRVLVDGWTLGCFRIHRGHGFEHWISPGFPGEKTTWDNFVEFFLELSLAGRCGAGAREWPVCWGNYWHQGEWSSMICGMDAISSPETSMPLSP